MIYCDASLLVALLVTEPHSREAAEWFRSQPDERLSASDWAVTEVGSALAFKLRLGLVDEAFHRRAVHRADELMSSLRVAPVERRHFLEAGRRHVLAGPGGLRAGDALHLAIIVDNGLELATLDRRFAAAAADSGVIVHELTSADCG